MKALGKRVVLTLLGVLALVYLGPYVTEWLRALSSWLRTIS